MAKKKQKETEVEETEVKTSKKKGGKKGTPADLYKVLDEETHKIRLNNVRLSFPHLFTPQPNREDATKPAKFNAVFLLDEETHSETIEYLQGIGQDLAKDLGMKKLPDSKSFLKPGEEKDEIEGFEGCYFVTASNTRRPLCLSADKEPLTEADGVLYPGCYVNAVIQVWPQDNKWGKRVNASLEGVQFYQDGESLGGGTVADEDDFE